MYYLRIFSTIDLEGIKGELGVFATMGMQATSKGNMPVVLLKEGGSETKGRDAQKNNIAACKIVSEIVSKIYLDSILDYSQNKMKENEKLIISVKAHEKTRYKDYVAVIDQLKIANAKRISIAETAD